MPEHENSSADMCHMNVKKAAVMIIKTSISILRKVFDSDMYFIRTETGTVVFDPQLFSDENIKTETMKDE